MPISNLKPSEVEYIAFEGGGGKGLAYLGAIRLLEDPSIGLLPVNTGRVKGLAGASAGAITSFFLAVGMSADEIQQRISKNDFARFWDSAYPGTYKAVSFDGSRNIPGYMSDSIDSHQEMTQDGPKTVIDRMTSGLNFTPDFGPGTKGGEQAQALLVKGYPILEGLKKAVNLFNLSKKVSQGTKIDLLRLLTTNPDGSTNDLKMFNYLYSELMDRGLFLGVGIRDYLRAAGAESLVRKFFVPMQIAGFPPDLFNPIKMGQLTFAEFYKITGRDFVVSSTNISTERPMLFSHERTPDFPVVEAVCMSMSIPMVFKPTFVNAVVNTSLPPNDPYNLAYKGFYVDGGALNNLPIHAWDEAPDKPMNPKVIGIRVTGGLDPSDDTYDKDPRWISYTNQRNKDEKRTGSDQIPYKRQVKATLRYNAAGSLSVEHDMKAFVSPIGTYAGDLLGTLMYPAEEGQIRTPDEKARTVEFFSYEIGVLDFTPNEDLRVFVQSRAEQKLRKYFGM